MGDRNLGAEILDGINEIKQFKKGKLALRTHELSEPSPPKGSERANSSGLGARTQGATRPSGCSFAHC